MTDPATRYAQALAAFICAARDLLNDNGYRAVLPAIETLVDVLPAPVAVRVPTPRREPEPEPHPLDAS